MAILREFSIRLLLSLNLAVPFFSGILTRILMEGLNMGITYLNILGILAVLPWQPDFKPGGNWNLGTR